MRLTVSICTWNRAGLLAKTLERMTELQIPADIEWELLVVNNNCTDETDQVISRFADRLPIRRLFEREQGLSSARNLAVREATGEYILFTDDDVLVDPDWISAYAAAFRRWPDAVFFGGPVRPWFEGTPPHWLSLAFPRIEFVFAALDLGPASRPFAGHDLPFGANMAFRSEVHRKFLYDPQIGPRLQGGFIGEETALLKAMLESGATGWWVPGAAVRHFIPRSRQTIGYVRRWYYRWGETVAQLPAKPEERRFMGRPLWLWREFVVSELKFRFRRLFESPESWIEDLKAASVARGRFLHARIRR